MIVLLIFSIISGYLEKELQSAKKKGRLGMFNICYLLTIYYNCTQANLFINFDMIRILTNVLPFSYTTRTNIHTHIHKWVNICTQT